MTQLHQSDTYISQQIQQLSKSNWQDQIHIINSIAVTQNLIKLINHRNYSSEIANLFAPHNPRSKLITTLSDFLISLFSNYSNQLITLANILITPQCLLRLLANGNKVIASSINQVIKCILSNTDYKQKAKFIKYVTHLQEQFISSKNVYVRQKISLYFMLISTSYYYSTKESLNSFQRKIVKIGLQDASQKVRKNTREILQNITNFQKQNMLQEDKISIKQSQVIKSRSKSNSKVILTVKNMNKQKSIDKGLRNQNKFKESNSISLQNSALINQSIILDNFKSSKTIKASDFPAEYLQQYKIYLSSLESRNSWSILSIHYQNLFILISKGILRHYNSQQLYIQTLQVLLPFTTEKRNKMYESCRKLIVMILNDVKKLQRSKVITYCMQNIQKYLQHIVKYENSQNSIVTIIISLNPSFFIPKLIEMTIKYKISRERLIILDIVIGSIDSYFQEISKAGKSSKKIVSVIKNLCEIIDISNFKQRQLGFAALAILSHFKNKYQQQVLSTLLCQNDKLLTKIISLASQIDESLKNAVIDYINNLKGNQKKYQQMKTNTIPPHEFTDIHQLVDIQLRSIRQNTVCNLNSLGQTIMSHMNHLSADDFFNIFRVVEYLEGSDLIMQFKILLTHIAKIDNQKYLQALLKVIQEFDDQTNQDRIYEHHQLLFIETLIVFLKNIGDLNVQMAQSLCSGLIDLYRKSKSVKKRKLAIEALSQLNSQSLVSVLNEKQMQLIEACKRKKSNSQYFLQLIN